MFCFIFLKKLCDFWKMEKILWILFSDVTNPCWQDRLICRHFEQYLLHWLVPCPICAFPLWRENTLHSHFAPRTWWDGTDGSQPGDSDWFCRQMILRVTLGPNSMPLEPGINGFQILAFTSASSCSQTHTIPAVQILKGWILEFSTRRDLITLEPCDSQTWVILNYLRVLKK